jgi:Transposase IS116/IS110/IS902 family
LDCRPSTGDTYRSRDPGRWLILCARRSPIDFDDPTPRRPAMNPDLGDCARRRSAIDQRLVAAAGEAKQVASGRRCTAWVGLVPAPNSTASKKRLGGCAKAWPSKSNGGAIHE